MTDIALQSDRARGSRSWAARWFLSTDHKKIGIMYMAAAFVFFLVGGMLAELVRTELVAPGPTITGASTYLGWVSMHGTIMIFLWLMPVLTGLINYVVPLTLGARDMAYPRLNALSFWLFVGGGLILMSTFVFGSMPRAGWVSYPPLSTRFGTLGEDIWIVSIFVLGISSTLAGINIVATVVARRAPGMTPMRMPLMGWGAIVTGWLMIVGMPPLIVALTGLYGDRHLGMIVYDLASNAGAANGDPLLYQHLFWFFGHPEVYILILPVFGVISEVIPVFSRKPLFGYGMMVWSIVAIAVLSMTVWAHHMFTSGMARGGTIFFMFTTMLIGVPTGIKMFNWAATMWRGKIILKTPMLFALGFMVSFIIGGFTGIMQASIPVDTFVHASYFIVGHIHYVLFGGSVMGVFAAIYFWYPKMFGRMLSERLGIVHFILTFIGIQATYMPYHFLGLKGMSRRLFDYPPELAPLHLVSTIGGYILGIAQIFLIINLIWAAFRGRRAGDNPWGAESLEWRVTSPPPEHNFDEIPTVTGDAYAYEPHADRDEEQPTRHEEETDE